MSRLITAIVSYIAVFMLVSITFHPYTLGVNHLLLAVATAFLLLLHMVLSIGPLCQLNKEFLPLLQYRRIMGIFVFFSAFSWGSIWLVQCHGYSGVNPITSFFSNINILMKSESLPFELMGFIAFILLTILVVISSNYWVKTLKPFAWKLIHLNVYFVYILTISWCLFGFLQTQDSQVLTQLLALGFTWVIGLHLVAALKMRKKEGLSTTDHVLLRDHKLYSVNSKALQKVYSAVFVFVLVFIFVFIGNMKEAYPVFYEKGIVQKFQGQYLDEPYPTLVLAHKKDNSNSLHYSRYYLVGEGKKGADVLFDGMDGYDVELEGRLIYRDNQTMVEVVAGSINTIKRDDQRRDYNRKSLGFHTLTGEIVASKCYLGAMTSGHTKTKRLCSMTAILGGVPPMFVAKDDKGHAIHLLLSDADGRKYKNEVLGLIAKPIEVTGEVVRYDNFLLLKAEPKNFNILEN